jgi:lysozyme
MNIDQAGIAFITSFEGCKLTVYPDPAGIPTVGIGHKLLPGESFPDGITSDQAQEMLMADLAPVQAAVNRLMDPSCTQGQFDALCDFGFNLGVGSLGTMLGHGWDQIPQQIIRWTHSDGQVVPGLVRRRLAEMALWNGQAPAPSS